MGFGYFCTVSVESENRTLFLFERSVVSRFGSMLITCMNSKT